ncbi:MAG: heat-inducible transcriptional repressor HrcA [Oscillospiraceae bacterium]|jgi:heat-inducible transcriptional repressor|nr:heat-inducible transcriptional repressor HrcA [Oscillospiraceae bacterium]
MALDERKKIILRAVVNDYIQTVEPVGSKALASRIHLKLSPATLRNEMSELEYMGYLEQPHTSSGRVPSHMGYRLYVDELMNIQRLTLSEMEAINKSLQTRLREIDRVITEAGRLTSELTNYAVYAASPFGARVTVRKVELVPLDPDSCIVVAVFSESSVKNSIIKSPEADKNRLIRISEIITAVLVNKSCEQITVSTALKISEDSKAPAGFIGAVVDFVAEAAREIDKRKIFIDGTAHILAQPEYKDVLKAQKLMEHLTNDTTAAMLPEPEQSGKVKILIGPENVSEALRDSSVAVASYEIGGGMHGFIGVVGPMRMDFSKVASRLGYLTGSLTKLLTGEPYKEDGGENENI